MKQKPTPPQPSPNPFNALCASYYRLSQLVAKRQERLQLLLDNAPEYTGETSIDEIDAMINYYQKTQAYKAKYDETYKSFTETGEDIRKVMQHFSIPPETVLTGQIPGELEYEVVAGEDDMVYIYKTKDLAPLEDNPNIITIKMCYGDERDVEED
jgi:hypothetical protein